MNLREAVAAYAERKAKHGRPFPDGSGWCIAEDHTGHGCMNLEDKVAQAEDL